MRLPEGCSFACISGCTGELAKFSAKAKWAKHQEMIHKTVWDCEVCSDRFRSFECFSHHMRDKGHKHEHRLLAESMDVGFTVEGKRQHRERLARYNEAMSEYRENLRRQKKQRVVPEDEDEMDEEDDLGANMEPVRKRKSAKPLTNVQIKKETVDSDDDDLIYLGTKLCDEPKLLRAQDSPKIKKEPGVGAASTLANLENLSNRMSSPEVPLLQAALSRRSSGNATTGTAPMDRAKSRFAPKENNGTQSTVPSRRISKLSGGTTATRKRSNSSINSAASLSQRPCIYQDVGTGNAPGGGPVGASDSFVAKLAGINDQRAQHLVQFPMDSPSSHYNITPLSTHARRAFLQQASDTPRTVVGASNDLATPTPGMLAALISTASPHVVRQFVNGAQPNSSATPAQSQNALKQQPSTSILQGAPLGSSAANLSAHTNIPGFSQRPLQQVVVDSLQYPKTASFAQDLDKSIATPGQQPNGSIGAPQLSTIPSNIAAGQKGPTPVLGQSFTTATQTTPSAIPNSHQKDVASLQQKNTIGATQNPGSSRTPTMHQQTPISGSITPNILPFQATHTPRAQHTFATPTHQLNSTPNSNDNLPASEAEYRERVLEIEFEESRLVFEESRLAFEKKKLAIAAKKFGLGGDQQ